MFHLGEKSVRYQLIFLVLLIPQFTQAQEVLNDTGICYQTLAGLEIYPQQQVSEEVIAGCFDDALAQCAANTDFTECITLSNAKIMEALEVAYTDFDQNSLEAALPGRRLAWESFENALLNLREQEMVSADGQMEKLRLLFSAATKINSLR